MAYYSSETCGYVNGETITSGCTSDYNLSDAKYVIDAWASDKFKEQELVNDSTGYSARLLTVDELHNNLGYGNSNNANDKVPKWININTTYWTMTSSNNTVVFRILNNANISGNSIYMFFNAVRPVVTLKKSALE